MNVLIYRCELICEMVLDPFHILYSIWLSLSLIPHVWFKIKLNVFLITPNVLSYTG